MREKLPASGARWIDEEVGSAIPRRIAPASAAALDAAMIHSAVRSLASGGERRTRPPTAEPASFGGEPSYVCEIPGEDEQQTLAASSPERAHETCEAMNAMPEGGRCTCREAELGSTLPVPIAER